ncbi:MAG: MerR family transcriptional regulator [Caulobacteraceae bacterium]
MTKGPDAFRTISEAADEVGVAQHVLRFWETKFPFVRPMKRAGGRRFYRPGDIEILAEIRRLLHQEGYSIARVRELHRTAGARRIPPGGRSSVAAGAADRMPPGKAGHERLTAALAALETAKARLDAALRA